MHWKKYISVGLTVFLMGGALAPLQPARSSYASSDTGNSGESSSGDNSGSSSGSASAGDSSGGSGSSSGGSDSSSSGSESGSSSDASESGSSSDASESGSSSNSSQGDGSGDSSGENKSDPSDSGSAPEGSSENTKAASSSEKTSKEKTSEATTQAKKKTVVKDDSEGRDYSDSEIVSSGKTYFTIVSVSKDGEKIDKKIKELEKQKKELESEKERYDEAGIDAQICSNDIQEIYDYVLSIASGNSESEASAASAQAEKEIDYSLLLLGSRRDASYHRKSDAIDGIDDMLSALAKKYHNTELIQWTEDYSIEALPQTIEISTMEDMSAVFGENQENEELTTQGVSAESTSVSLTEDASNPLTEEEDNKDTMYSSPVTILEEMKSEAELTIKKADVKSKEDAEKIEDITEHVKSLKKQKEENTYDLDSRLVEYKDVIPDQAVAFLNAAVAKEGCPYVWGADGPNSFDCSGLVSYALRQAGAVSSGFRWTSYDFAGQLKSIPFSEAKPGDLAWKHGHIAIYIDANTVFEAPYTGALVRFTSCDVSSRFSRILRWWNTED